MRVPRDLSGPELIRRLGRLGYVRDIANYMILCGKLYGCTIATASKSIAGETFAQLAGNIQVVQQVPREQTPGPRGLGED